MGFPSLPCHVTHHETDLCSHPVIVVEVWGLESTAMNHNDIIQTSMLDKYYAIYVAYIRMSTVIIFSQIPTTCQRA